MRRIPPEKLAEIQKSGITVTSQGRKYTGTGKAVVIQEPPKEPEKKSEELTMITQLALKASAALEQCASAVTALSEKKSLKKNWTCVVGRDKDGRIATMEIEER